MLIPDFTANLTGSPLSGIIPRLGRLLCRLLIVISAVVFAALNLV